MEAVTYGDGDLSGGGERKIDKRSIRESYADVVTFCRFQSLRLDANLFYKMVVRIDNWMGAQWTLCNGKYVHFLWLINIMFILSC